MTEKAKKNPSASLARSLRRNETDTEQIVWSWLRNRQLNGIKFRRQQPVGNYVVDFVSYEKRLVIEIDGGQHSEEHTIDLDSERTKWLESQGFRVMRFWNNDVRSNMNGVYLCIKEALEMGHPHPDPLPSRERGLEGPERTE